MPDRQKIISVYSSMRFFVLGVQYTECRMSAMRIRRWQRSCKGQRRVQSCQEHLLFLKGVFKVRVLDVVVASARNGQLGAAGHDELFRRDRLDML